MYSYDVLLKDLDSGYHSSTLLMIVSYGNMKVGHYHHKVAFFPTYCKIITNDNEDLFRSLDCLVQLEDESSGEVSDTLF